MQLGTDSRGGSLDGFLIHHVQHVRLFVLLAGLFFWAGNADGADVGARTADAASLAERANTLLGLRESTIVALDFGGTAAVGTDRSALTITVPIKGMPYTLELSPHSVRSDKYEVLAQLADGSYVNVTPGPVRTYRGTVAEIDGSAVAASLLDNGLHARIILPTGVTYWLEPLDLQTVGAIRERGAGMQKSAARGRSAGAQPTDGGSIQHVVYQDDDVIPSGGTCILQRPPAGVVVEEGGLGDESGATSGAAGGGLTITELAIDSDFEFFLDFQGEEDPFAAVEGRINDIINTVNIQYERDVAIQHVITTIIIRSAEPDPYFGTCIGGRDDGSACEDHQDCGPACVGGPDEREPCLDDQDCFGGTCQRTCAHDARELLQQFRNQWRNVHGNIQRDVAQLFTGKNLLGSTIGIAWLNGICSSSFGYGVVESNCSGCSSFARKTDLTAHELGHNWAADHCGGADCQPSCLGYTMNCGLTGANRFHETFTIPEILTFRDTRSCTDQSDELRRIILTADDDTVLEGETLQFTLTADFRFAGDQDVTSEAIWWVDRPKAGAINGNGLFGAFDVDGNTCVKVSAEYTFDDVPSTKDKTIVVIDTDAPFAVNTSVPPRGSIDARQPSAPDGSDRVGWESIDITFNGETCLLEATDFSVITEDLNGSAATLFGLQRVPPKSVRVFLDSDGIEPGTWTTVTHLSSGASARIGYLPGDVNGDGITGPADIFALIDMIEGVGDALPIWSSDIDRSGRVAPSDILRAIDLLNGAEEYETWNGRTLP